MHRLSFMVRGVVKPAGVLAAALSFLLPAPAAAAIAWDGAWDVTVNGQRLSVESFRSRYTVDAAAQALMRENAAWERFMVADGRLFMSGVDSGVHWLAEVRSHPEGSEGYVSALYFDPAQSSPAQSLAGVVTAATAMKPHRNFHFDGGVSVGLSAHTGPDSPAAVAVSLPEQ